MKEWKVKKNEFGEEWHELRFSPFYEDDDEVIASFVQDEMDDKAFYYISKELSADDDLLWADSIDDAKQQIEEMLIEHWKDEIEYLEDRLKEFQEISRKIKVTRCEGEGQGSCKRCIDKGTWNQMWMSSLYKIEGLEGCYCAKCVDEIMKETK